MVSGLETFLRGMETGRGPRGGTLPAAALKPSLEGWKLHEAFPVGGFRDTLKPSLEGWKPASLFGSLGLLLGP